MTDEEALKGSRGTDPSGVDADGQLPFGDDDYTAFRVTVTTAKGSDIHTGTFA